MLRKQQFHACICHSDNTCSAHLNITRSTDKQKRTTIQQNNSKSLIKTSQRTHCGIRAKRCKQNDSPNSFLCGMDHGFCSWKQRKASGIHAAHGAKTKDRDTQNDWSNYACYHNNNYCEFAHFVSQSAAFLQRIANNRVTAEQPDKETSIQHCKYTNTHTANHNRTYIC